MPHTTESPDELRQRSIRSYVVRAGRMGPGQVRALASLGPQFVLPFAPTEHDFAASFQRNAPRVAKDALHGVPDCYKIKITTPQFRLAYHVDDKSRLPTILAVSSRDDVYELLQARRR